MKTPAGLIASLLTLTAGASEYAVQPYKNVDDRELLMHIVSPDGHAPDARAPAVAYFHGGGWQHSSPESGFPYAEALARHGIVTLAAEYRLTDAATPDEIIADALSAIRWTRERARRLGIHPGRIVALGHSAGGHLAASTAMLPGFDEAGGLHERESTSERACIAGALCRHERHRRRVLAPLGRHRRL